jgi:hypothetical protein
MLTAALYYHCTPPPQTQLTTAPNLNDRYSQHGGAMLDSRKEVFGEKLLQCHYIHYMAEHTGIEPWSPQRQAGD